MLQFFSRILSHTQDSPGQPSALEGEPYLN